MAGMSAFQLVASDADAYDDADLIRTIIDQRTAELLEHRYFERCRTGSISREQMLNIVEQLYCFSVFFERILTRRVARYTSSMRQDVLRLARTHLKEEIGHAELFRSCLLSNGRTEEELDNITPKPHTKAMFGYLLATVEYEHEVVTNIAIMQVMETIGMHFFEATFHTMERHGLHSTAFAEHAEDDKTHSQRGMDLYVDLEHRVLADAERVINDAFHLMGLVFEEWLSATAARASIMPPSGIVRSSRVRRVGAA